MKLLRIALVLLLVSTTTVALAASGAQTSFDKLKTLSGTWEGKSPDGKMVEVSYRVTSNGSALMSEIHTEDDMITMFHPDGDRLLMTHYCGAGNQPRMVGILSPDGKTITFDFLDATNLPTSEAGHMHRMVLSFLDANHHTEAWSYVDHGKEMNELFDLKRKN